MKIIDDKLINQVADEAEHEGNQDANRNGLAGLAKEEIEETGETDIDLEQFGKFAETQCAFYNEIAAKLNEVFGQDVIRKYFRVSYEINPEFVPDDLAIQDFLESITPVMEQVFQTRFERMNGKYSKDRKGKRSGKK